MQAQGKWGGRKSMFYGEKRSLKSSRVVSAENTTINQSCSKKGSERAVSGNSSWESERGEKKELKE